MLWQPRKLFIGKLKINVLEDVLTVERLCPGEETGRLRDVASVTLKP